MILHPPTELCSRPRELFLTLGCCVGAEVVDSGKKFHHLIFGFDILVASFLGLLRGPSSFAARHGVRMLVFEYYSNNRIGVIIRTAEFRKIIFGYYSDSE